MVRYMIIRQPEAIWYAPIERLLPLTSLAFDGSTDFYSIAKQKKVREAKLQLQRSSTLQIRSSS